MSNKKVYKVIVIGDSNVGKTCLTYRFCEGKFPSTPSVTIGMDFRQRKLEINGETLTLQLWDTAGLERNRRTMVKHYYRNVQAIILVYDVTNLKSFESLGHWIEECEKHTFDEDVLKIMVGNKCDEGSVVNTHMAQRFADRHNMPLFETSAKLDSEFDNVEGIFVTLAHKLVNSQPLMRNAITLTQITNTYNPPDSKCCYFF